MSSKEEAVPSSNELGTDQELDELLDSALEDFDKPNIVNSTDESSAQTSNKSKDCSPNENSLWNEEFLLEAQKLFEQNFKTLLGGEESMDAEKFGEQLQKMAKDANTLFAQEGNDPEFSTTIAETLKSLTDNSENLQSELGADDLSSLLNGLGLGGSEAGPDFLPFMQNMMSSFLSKDVFYPSIKEVADKYPCWLEENKSKISEKDYDNYMKQCEIMKKVCTEIEKETDTDSDEVKKERFTKILSLLEEIQKLGQPPKELVGVDTPFNLDESGLPSPLPGVDPSQCCLM